MIPLLLAVAAGIGVFLMYSALSLGWSGLGFGPRIGGSSRSRTRSRTIDINVWLQQAGLDGVDKKEFFAVVAMLFVVVFPARLRGVRRSLSRPGNRRFRGIVSSCLL